MSIVPDTTSGIAAAITALATLATLVVAKLATTPQEKRDKDRWVKEGDAKTFVDDARATLEKSRQALLEAKIKQREITDNAKR